MELGSLSAKYESNGTPGTISSGEGDMGMASYGAWQLSLNMGSLQEFVNWASKQPEPYGNYGEVLSAYELGSEDFDVEWKLLAELDPEGFLSLQREFIKERYYDPALNLLKNIGLDVSARSFALQQVLWSRAVQYGAGNMIELFVKAAELSGYDVGNLYFGYVGDYDLIYNVYEVNLTDPSWTSGSPELRSALFARFESEREDALKMLTE